MRLKKGSKSAGILQKVPEESWFPASRKVIDLERHVTHQNKMGGNWKKYFLQLFGKEGKASY